MPMCIRNHLAVVFSFADYSTRTQSLEETESLHVNQLLHYLAITDPIFRV